MRCTSNLTHTSFIEKLNRGRQSASHNEPDNYSHFGDTVLPCSVFLGGLKWLNRTHDKFKTFHALATSTTEKAGIVVSTALKMQDILVDAREELETLNQSLELDDAQIDNCIIQLDECCNMLNAVIIEANECRSNQHTHVALRPPKRRKWGWSWPL